MSAADEFRAAAAERILIKDGAYGTMIQSEGLKEADYRGELALNHDQRGNNDLLNLTRPDIVGAIARRFVEVGGGYPRYQQLQRHPHQPGRLWRRKPGRRHQPGRGADHSRSGR